MEDLSAALTVEAEAPAAEPAVDSKAEPKSDAKPEAKAEKADKAAEDTLDADLKKVFRKNNPHRENGKFAAKEAKDEPASTEKAEKAPEAKDAPKTETKPDAKVEAKADEKPAEAPKPVNAPAAWKAEMKAKFGTLPPDVQAYVTERETEAHRAISMSTDAAKKFQSLDEHVFGPHKDYLKGVGQPVPQFLSNLVSAAHQLDTNPKAMIKQLADHYGVDLLEFDPLQPAPDPEVSALKTQVAELTRRLQGEDNRRAAEAQQQRDSRVQDIQRQLDEFKADKPDYAEVEHAFEANLRALHAKTPTAELKSLLPEAYDAAIWANPRTRAALIEQQSREAETRRIEEAKKAANQARAAASINVQERPRESGPLDLDSDLRGIWRKNQRA